MTSDPIRRLKTYGRDLSTLPLSRLPETFDKVCFLCVNSYTSYRLSLGTGPINDGVNFAKRMKTTFGFEVYFYHNPHCKAFLNYLDAFFSKTTGHLVFFYVGHGTNVTDTDGDEADKKDEALVFEDGNIPDDVLIDHLISQKNPANKLTLVTDACHSGSIWDIQSGNANGRKLPERIISVSAATDAQTAKQTTINRQDQGVFTYNLAKKLKTNPESTPNQLKTALKKELRKYGQTFSVASTTKEFLTQPLFE